MSSRAVEVVVHGRVQGVFFRDSCRAEAQRAGVAGWVRNEPDGTVRARLEGDPEAVGRVLAWAENGPPHAEVERVEVEEVAPSGLGEFRVR